jgi:nucleoside phosphorylase
MAKQNKQKKKKVSLVNALDKGKMHKYFDVLLKEDLSRLRDNLRNELFYWLANPSLERLNKLKEKYSFLSKMIDFNIVNKRLDKLDEFEGHFLGVHISEFMPELKEISEECEKRFSQIMKGVEKAKLWLLPIAEDASADSNVEAAVYFASRGLASVDPDVLKRRWHETICQRIIQGQPSASRLTEDIKTRAGQKLISLSEAAELLNFLDTMPRFFYSRREEEEFIDATFFRGVEWFNLRGFEPWVKSFGDEFSSFSLTEPMLGSWLLFFLCRSDLLLKNVKRIGLEGLLWGLLNGQIERTKPWKQYSLGDKGLIYFDYIPIASAAVFAWERIKPSNLEKPVVDTAVQLLFGTQMLSGAWPIRSNETEGSIISTCFAIHALAVAKPQGWEQACNGAKDWLLKQQDDYGCWHIQGGPTVMLTVLALDSIDLADGKTDVTFRISHAGMPTARQIEDPEYDYSHEPWHNPDDPELLSMSKENAIKKFKTCIALIVATEVELKQALYRLKPAKGRKIVKVSFGPDTFFLGRFGQFETVLIKSSMGTEGPRGSMLTVDSVIKTWKPKVAILAGIAFGAKKEKQKPGDILVADAIIPYENQRIGETIVFRNPIAPSSSILLNRFENALGWNFKRPDKSKVSVYAGPMLSGGKLVDSLEFKKTLLDQFPTAIGGEMEGSGIYAAGTRNNTDWIVVKAVCDWADGYKHKDYQELAAASSMSLCEHVLSDRHALDGI